MYFFPYLMQIVKVKDKTTLIGRKLNTTTLEKYQCKIQKITKM